MNKAGFDRINRLELLHGKPGIDPKLKYDPTLPIIIVEPDDPPPPENSERLVIEYSCA